MDQKRGVRRHWSETFATVILKTRGNRGKKSGKNEQTSDARFGYKDPRPSRVIYSFKFRSLCERDDLTIYTRGRILKFGACLIR